MVQDIVKKLKDYKKNLEKFKKISSNDKEEAIKMAKSLIKDTELFLKRDDLGFNEKQKKQLEKTKEGLNLYVVNVESILKFEKKW